MGVCVVGKRVRPFEGVDDVNGRSEVVIDEAGFKVVDREQLEEHILSLLVLLPHLLQLLHLHIVLDVGREVDVGEFEDLSLSDCYRRALVLVVWAVIRILVLELPLLSAYVAELGTTPSRRCTRHMAASSDPFNQDVALRADACISFQP